MENENKLLSIQFLISECQETIKYIETKATISITVIAGFIIAIFEKIDLITTNFNNYDTTTIILLSLLGTLIIISIFVLVSIINPIQNPSKSIQEVDKDIEIIKIYFPKNKYENKILSIFKVNNEKDSLNYSFSKFIKNLKSDEKTIINSFSFELFKLSFIRNIKKDRLEFLIKIIIATSIIFFITFAKLTKSNEIINQQNKMLKVAIR